MNSELEKISSDLKKLLVDDTKKQSMSNKRSLYDSDSGSYDSADNKRSRTGIGDNNSSSLPLHLLYLLITHHLKLLLLISLFI